MKSISESVKKKDHDEKMSGRAVYIADMKMDHMLYGKILRSTIAHGTVKDILLPTLPMGYYIIDAKDIPGENILKVVTSEQPIFSEGDIQFIGEAILMIVGPDKALTESIVSRVKVIYEEKPPILTMEEATQTAANYHYEKGDTKNAFSKAAKVIEETFYTGYQEQAYIEPQGCIGVWNDGKIIIYGSMQCPYYVKGAVMQTMGMGEEQVQIIQTVTGGGFGGKEDYPSLIGCQVAVAAAKTKQPVQLIFNRREDMEVTPKRHPAKLYYKAAIDELGKITALKVDIKLDAGAYAGLSSVVLQRSIIAAAGVYHIDNLDVTGSAMLTNTVPNGAFRGFGAPQSFFAIETFMNHIARNIGVVPLDLKKMHLAKQNDSTSTNGRFHYPVPLLKMIERMDDLSGYTLKYQEYAKPQTGRYHKGIGMSIFLHGCGFTGSAEKDFIKSVVILKKYQDDTVEILASTTDMGQGIKTTFSKIVSHILEIPLDQVKILNPDTDRVPNSGPTVASRSLMIVGKLIERAATRMKVQWQANQPLTIEEQYKHPYMIPWDAIAFQGDAYPTYSYGINVVEIEVDTLLAATKILGVWGIFDVGKVIDDTIMQGQAQGGMLQGIGFGSMEKMEHVNGKIYQSSMTDYMIPTAKDTNLYHVEFVDNLYEDGPFGAKGAGELTLIGTAPAYAAAVEHAISKRINTIPITPERIMEVL